MNSTEKSNPPSVITIEVLSPLISGMPVALAVLNSRSEFISANEKWMDLFELSPAKIEGQSFFTVMFGLQNFTDWHLRGVLKGLTQVIKDGQFTRSDGNMESIYLDARPIVCGNTIDGICLFADKIFDRKSAEEFRNRLQVQKKRTAAHLEAVENERRKIARDLHDGLGQLITAAHLNIEIVEDLVLKNPLEISKVLLDVKKILNQSLREIRHIAGNLRPALLDDFGLIPALRHLCDEIKVKDLSIKFTSFEIEDRLSPSLETTVYRICQEAINNIARHSEAHHARVDLYKRNDHLVVHIQDDGIGITAKTKHSGSGLAHIRERVELMRGSFQIESRPNKGTEIIIDFPLMQIEEKDK